ncbi:PTS sugar transporter subunit IIB [Butyrivibrio sp. MC2013]|uniref:PTS sugar transporter subunit IIB n=1 Tax=Butyrivibrio sp. MC2013 TaxID=1280686 RepID=UPI00047C477C|nr:PTS sugar transporter subunit IIB [Butyrivibrio sp. MC2013]
MVSILACCANGAGTSLMMAMTLDKVVKEKGWNVSKTHHCNLEEGKETAENYDVVLCPQNFIGIFDPARDKGVKVIGLKNVLSAQEITEKLEASGVPLV